MTTAMPTLGSPARPYFVPVPNSLPPYDDELPAGRPIRRSARVEVRAHPREVAMLPPLPASHPARRPATATDTDEAGVLRTATTLGRALTEVISKRRPLNHLRQFCTPQLFLGLSKFTTAGPLEARSLRLCQPAPGVAEVAMVTRSGQRARAVAFRMELKDHWIITALEIG